MLFSRGSPSTADSPPGDPSSFLSLPFSVQFDLNHSLRIGRYKWPLPRSGDPSPFPSRNLINRAASKPGLRLPPPPSPPHYSINDQPILFFLVLFLPPCILLPQPVTLIPVVHPSSCIPKLPPSDAFPSGCAPSYLWNKCWTFQGADRRRPPLLF